MNFIVGIFKNLLQVENEAIIIGAVVTVILGYKSQTMRIPLSKQINEVKGGGWQYILYADHEFIENRSLEFFTNNLLSLSRNHLTILGDIVINTIE